MMLLADLLKDLYEQPIPLEFASQIVKSISCDSRKIEPGTFFVAVQGVTGHGQKFIDDAVRKGARIVVCPQSNLDISYMQKHADVCFLPVRDPEQILRRLLERFYGRPSAKVRAVGITGTNGKTTISYLLESILGSAGHSCGVVGTINYRYGSKILPSHNTTPGIVENQAFLAEMAATNVEYCVMEVSSHALAQGRVDLIDFKAAVFTNLTSDHMDYHKDREDYFLAKSKLFAMLSDQAAAILPSDDEYGQRLVKMTKSRVVTYGVTQPADFRAKDLHMGLSETRFVIRAPEGEIPLATRLIGLHNVYNILAATAVCAVEGIPLSQIRAGLERLDNVPGRLEQIRGEQDFHVFVDYAHTEDALKNILTSIRGVSDRPVILVFGCGGDRDRTKRPRMGRVASELADRVILTDDNPRSEDPQAIVDEIIPGFARNNYTVILDRETAIRTALGMAGKGDVVVVAGKGHEDYQIFKDKTVPFKEHDVIRQYLRELKTPAGTERP
ncbi:MAG: UDP-N-acetylmuramoyl-L-alanyl-D-glutamate--2,6-diaminopimelate ligase [Candidatus Omnitrophota bacterium]|nr:UDP-N-acetylmuramoyl-L-alanyl-D-glutamate--2,6-diaminopimelate ligase [Candidatus Omnitrophota bacterium]MDZ4242425.1 UDP-N-acetylmuramoyl-L-alanyl-D-glutamate--2,6-diaminopimelate ligase [Candidatus Omnitrophota bacterium]